MENLPEEEAAELQIEQPRDTHKVNRLMMLGLFIGNLRKERGLTATALAQKAGVHPSVITRIEQGYTTSLHERNQQSIALALGIEPEMLHHLENVPAMPLPQHVLKQIQDTIPEREQDTTNRFSKEDNGVSFEDKLRKAVQIWEEQQTHPSDDIVKEQAAHLQKWGEGILKQFKSLQEEIRALEAEVNSKLSASL